jgi:hypothetical protein
VRDATFDWSVCGLSAPLDAQSYLVDALLIGKMDWSRVLEKLQHPRVLGQNFSDKLDDAVLVGFDDEVLHETTSDTVPLVGILYYKRHFRRIGADAKETGHPHNAAPCPGCGGDSHVVSTIKLREVMREWFG